MELKTLRTDEKSEQKKKKKRERKGPAQEEQEKSQPNRKLVSCNRFHLNVFFMTKKKKRGQGNKGGERG